VLVPTAQLWQLPWAELFDAPVSVAPSAASWLRTAEAARASGPVVLVAGPDLPGASTEVATLAAAHSGATILAPPTSTPTAVAAALSRAGLAHVASHGRTRSDNPAFSSLLLCEGELTIYELAAAGGVPSRVVLSACELGADTPLAGEELLGLVTALLAGGTSGLLVSVVPVPDGAVIPLMREVHDRLLRGATMAEALYGARSTVARDEPDDARAFAARCGFLACGAA
jgi:CHAT domain-containing protein